MYIFNPFDTVLKQSSHFHVNAAGCAFSFFFLDVLYWTKRPFGLIQTLWQSAQCSLIADLHHPHVSAPVIFSSHWSGSSSGGCVTMTEGSDQSVPPAKPGRLSPLYLALSKYRDEAQGVSAVSAEIADL